MPSNQQHLTLSASYTRERSAEAAKMRTIVVAVALLCMLAFVCAEVRVRLPAAQSKPVESIECLVQGRLAWFVGHTAWISRALTFALFLICVFSLPERRSRIRSNKRCVDH